MRIPTIAKARTSSKLLILAWFLLPLASVLVPMPAQGRSLVSISVTPANPSVPSGMTQQFTATGTYSHGSTQNLTSSVTWSSNNPAVATITKAGLAAAVTAGSTTIQASLGSIGGSTGLTVTAGVLVSLAVTPTNASIVSGTTRQFTATATFSDGATQNLTNSVTWTSTNTAAAAITGAGMATGVATGNTTIQASWSSITGSTNLTVGTTGQLVQWEPTDAGASSSETAYLDRNVTRGNLLLIFSHWDNQALTASVTDSLGNTYIPIGGPVNAGETARFEVWYAKNIRGGAPLAVKVTYSGKTTAFSVVDAAEYSGLDRSAPLDVFASASGSGTSQDSGPSPTTTVSNEIIIGLFGYSSYSSPYTAGVGFTLRQYEASTMLEDRSVIATGSYHATATSNRSDSWAALVIGFKSAIQPPVTLSLNPGTVAGGSASTATVRLNAPAPAGGATVTLASGNVAGASVPASVTVPAGATATSFMLSTSGVVFATSATISATYSGATQSANLQVVPVS